MWTIIDTGASSAKKNMELDVSFLDQMMHDKRGPILHLYDWEAPSATYGHFINPDRFISQEGVLQLGLQIAKRPTGGGVTFHLTDLAFSMIVPADHPGYSPNVLDNYAFVNDLVSKAVKRFTGYQADPILLPLEPQAEFALCKHFCMAKPTRYDVMLEGRKIAGGAQRRTKHAFLHQGSIALKLPDIDVLQALLPDPALIEAMQTHSHSLLSPSCSSEQLKQAIQEMKQSLINVVLQS